MVFLFDLQGFGDPSQFYSDPVGITLIIAARNLDVISSVFREFSESKPLRVSKRASLVSWLVVHTGKLPSVIESFILGTEQATLALQVTAILGIYLLNKTQQKMQTLFWQ